MKFLENANFDWMDMLNWRERPFRATFVPAKVWTDLDSYRNDSKGLSNYFKKWRTKIEFRKEPSKAQCYKTKVACGGEYDPTTRQATIFIYTNHYDSFPFTNTSWERFKYRLIQVTMHEIIHMVQFDRRGDEWSGYVLPFKKVKQAKKNEERKYLSEFDEIQAYAHCVLTDFKCFKPTITTSTLINRAKQVGYSDSRTLHYILKVFDFDYRNNKAIPKLLDQIMKWDRKYQKVACASRRS